MKLKNRYVIGVLVAVIIVAMAVFSFFRKRGPVGPTPDEMVNELLAFDKNGDGQLSKDELSERMLGLITRGDVNQDGILTRDELRKLAESDEAARRNAREDRR